MCVLACLVVCPFVCSSESSDSHLPIIQRGEGSTEETYDESYGDDREYQEDDHSLSSDMYCWETFTLQSSSWTFSLAGLTSSPRLCAPVRLVYHDETCKQLVPMEEAEEVEEQRRGQGWQSPRRVFLCPTTLGEKIGTDGNLSRRGKTYWSYLHIHVCIFVPCMSGRRASFHLECLRRHSRPDISQKTSVPLHLVHQQVVITQNAI